MKTLFLVAALALAACSPQPAVTTGTVPELDGAFGFSSLDIVNDNGEILSFDIYLAVQPDQQRRGLMYVREMPATTGMLFIYEEDAYHSMWMKNTYMPLDMVFARSDGSVSSVITDTVPLTLDSHVSTEPVRYVLELRAGTSRRLAIGKRSRLLWEEQPD
ncbi:MAG: DUF192 domain-containing protein [Planctomycetes bacterium]|jgi:uncharacterized membrane protein (UPF0127 family)|nr:DUF192 domain-containing protein [Planctomycetota bacterium]